jgi:tRNA pseudouridine65 synthase
MSFTVLYQDDDLVVIDKPEGFHVHKPEDRRIKVPKDRIIVHQLRDQLGLPASPVHRLDAATSGIVLFARDREATRALSLLFAERLVEKTYRAVARGFVDDAGAIELPLEISGFEKKMESETRFRALARVELPHAVGRYPTARYSLVEVRPRTGRWHQIRRHFDRVAHPLIGDVEHGDSHHNRFFRDTLGIRGLCLRAESLAFRDPWSGEPRMIRAPANEKWTRIGKLFGAPESCWG